MNDQSARFVAAGIDTPALAVDVTALDGNLASMADYARTHGMALRPHAKTHKSPAIAARQMAAGAVGLSVATLGEAEVFVQAGIEDVFVAYPVWPQPDTGARLDSVARQCRLSVGADSVAAVRALATLGLSGRLEVMVEVDCGLGRTGVAPHAAVAIAAAAAEAGFGPLGVFTFPGHAYGPGLGMGAAQDERRALMAARQALEAAGLPCPVASGGSTPSAWMTQGPVPDELRPGVYALGDAQQVILGTCTPDQVALAAVATVVSRPVPERAVLDAGSKVLGPDRPAWMPGHGLVLGLPGAVVTGLWEHHAVVDLSAVAPAKRPGLGDRVAVVPNHVCTAVNLSPVLHAVEAGRLVERWPVAARDRNR